MKKDHTDGSTNEPLDPTATDNLPDLPPRTQQTPAEFRAYLAKLIEQEVQGNLPGLTTQMLINLPPPELKNFRKAASMATSPKDYKKLNLSLHLIGLDRRFASLDEGINASIKEFGTNPALIYLNIAAEGWRGTIDPTKEGSYKLRMMYPPIDVPAEDLAKRASDLFESFKLPILVRCNSTFEIAEDGILTIDADFIGAGISINDYLPFALKIKNKLGNSRKVILKWNGAPFEIMAEDTPEILRDKYQKALMDTYPSKDLDE